MTLEHKDIKRDFGAIGDGITDDTKAFINALSTPDIIINIPAGTYFFSKDNFSSWRDYPNFAQNTQLIGEDRDKVIISTDSHCKQVGTTYDERSLFLINNPNCVVKNITFDLSKTHLNRQKPGINKVISASRADNLIIENIKIHNMYSIRYLLAIGINVGCKNYTLKDIEFENLSVEEGIGGEGALEGSVRGIYVGYAKVGADPREKVGYGLIENIIGRNFTPYKDTDLIQCIANPSSEFSDPYSFSSLIKIHKVVGINIGKRVVKAQISGIEIEDIYADATNPTNGTGYMLSIVAALNGSQSIRKVRGKGKFLAAVSCLDKTDVYDVHIESTWTASEINKIKRSPTTPCCAILDDFGTNLNLSTLTVKGLFLNTINVRSKAINGTYRPIKSVVINGLHADPTLQQSITINTGNSGQKEKCNIIDIRNAYVSTYGDKIAAIEISGLDSDGIPLQAFVNLQNINAAIHSSATKPYYWPLYIQTLECNMDNLNLTGGTEQGFELHKANKANIKNTISSKGIGSYVNCNNTNTTNCTSHDLDFGMLFSGGKGHTIDKITIKRSAQPINFKNGALVTTGEIKYIN